MKFCIIALPRSRSSILLETISLHYGIGILGEDIGEIKARWGAIYATIVRALLTKVLNEPRGVIRLHPLQMISIKRQGFDVFDFNWFNFEQYDKIYFTYRESVSDSIASAFVAEKLNRFTYKHADQLVKITDPFYFSKTTDFQHAVDYINGVKIMSSLKEYLNSNSIKYDNLDYNNIPNYISNEFPNTKTFHIETNYNYKEMISNYDDILELYNEHV